MEEKNYDDGSDLKEKARKEKAPQNLKYVIMRKSDAVEEKNIVLIQVQLEVMEILIWIIMTRRCLKRKLKVILLKKSDESKDANTNNKSSDEDWFIDTFLTKKTKSSHFTELLISYFTLSCY